MKHPNAVEIVNPIDGYARTSYRRAKKFVAEKAAEFTPEGKLLFTSPISSLQQAFRGPIRPPLRHGEPVDVRQFPVDTTFWDGRGVLKFWEDQRSVQ